MPPGLLFLTGDFNVQVGSPRDEEETEVAAALDGALARLQLQWTTEHLGSRRGQRLAQLDGIAVPHTAIALWRVRAKWQPGALGPRCPHWLPGALRRHHRPSVNTRGRGIASA